MGNTLEGYVYRLNKNDPDLVEIHCSEEGIQDIGNSAMDLAAALAHNHTLTFLDLNNMNLGNQDAIMLAHALVRNRTITLIRLHCNKIRNEGARALLTAMRHNHTVTTLFLQMNNIKDHTLEQEIQKLVNINKEAASPEEAARQKQAMFGAEWAVEGARLRKLAEEQFAQSEYNKAEERQQELVRQQKYEEQTTVYQRVTGTAHEKKD
jgi:Ran GTPase-activating protein (RanGAP) involved in mRNA processing and transport